ncbi:MAG TPA: RNA methyltransferase, partial [Verrucomicrobiae bacterium]
MKLHHHLIADIVAALLDIFAQEQRAERVIDRFIKSHPKWGARDRRLFAESVYEVVRWWRWYWHLAGLPDAECVKQSAATIARLWQVWAMYWFERSSELPAFDECADLNTEEIQRRRDTAVPFAVRESIPDWLHRRGENELGADWEPMLAAMNRPADVFLRANTLRISARELKDALAKENIAAEEMPDLPDALRLVERKKFSNSRAFRDGLFEVQDAGS